MTEREQFEAALAANPRWSLIGPLFSAPPAQQPQYEAADMASAAAQGFRDGVASVAQQPHEIEVQCPVCNHKFYEWPNDQQPQAEAVPQTKQALADALYALQVPHVACQDGLVTRCMCRKCVIKRGDEALAAPQQAEAVPKDHPLYVFATEVIHGAYRYTELPAKAKAAIAAQGEKP